MRELVSRHRALEIIGEHAAPAPSTRIPTYRSLGLVASCQLSSRFPIPPAPRSTRDGYGFCAADTLSAPTSNPVTLIITGMQPAEGGKVDALAPSSACRIFTGGPLPKGCDTVIPQEDAIIKEGRLVFEAPYPEGRFVARPGSDMDAGTSLTQPGEEISTTAAAALCRSGMETVDVYPAPFASSLALGNELRAPWDVIDPDRFASDNLLLTTALMEQAGAGEVVARTVADTMEETTAAMDSIPEHGVGVTTGGTGPGDRDFARNAAREAGFEFLFDGVEMRPGTSSFLARRDNTLLFGLPGPPHAVFAVMHALVLPAVRMKRGLPAAKPVMAKLARNLMVKSGPEWLAPCTTEYQDGQLVVSPLPRNLPTYPALLETNAFIPTRNSLEAGVLVEILPTGA